MGGEEGRDETEGEGSMKYGKQTIGRSVVEDLHCGFSVGLYHSCCTRYRTTGHDDGVGLHIRDDQVEEL